VALAAGLTSPLASTITLKEAATQSALAAGQPATITLTVTNAGNRPASGVVVKDEPPSPLGYVPGSTTVDGRPLPDGEEQGAPLAAGVPIPTLAPRASATVTYLARSATPVPTTQALALPGTVSSTEEPAPSAANTPRPLSLEELQVQAARLKGISS